MISICNLAISIFGSVFSAPLIYSQDLSRYREFQFGARLPVVAKQVHMKLSEARTIHERPAVIQELKWQAQGFLSSSPRTESVKDIIFSFYQGELFRIVVTYDPDRIEGMTAEDIVQAVSVRYGNGTRPVAEIVLSSTYLYNDGEKIILDQSEKVIARWEDSQYSFNLFQSSSQATLGLVAYSKRVNALAQTAIVEAIRLDKQEAPQREIERQKKKDEENRAKQERARRANKAPFRP